MATRESIEIDFRQAMAQADKIDEIASSLRNLSNNSIQGVMNDLSANWKGESSQKYNRNVDILKGKVNESASDLREIADAIRSAARRIYQAEMAAINLVNS